MSGTFTARELMTALHGRGLTAEWANTGGGVMNVFVCRAGMEDVSAGVWVSASGDWTEGDDDYPVPSVSVLLCDHLGEVAGSVWAPGAPTLDDECGDYVVAESLGDAVALVVAAVAYGEGQ